MGGFKVRPALAPVIFLRADFMCFSLTSCASLPQSSLQDAAVLFSRDSPHPFCESSSHRVYCLRSYIASIVRALLLQSIFADDLTFFGAVQSGIHESVPTAIHAAFSNTASLSVHGARLSLGTRSHNRYAFIHNFFHLSFIR